MQVIAGTRGWRRIFCEDGQHLRYTGIIEPTAPGLSRVRRIPRSRAYRTALATANAISAASAGDIVGR